MTEFIKLRQNNLYAYETQQKYLLALPQNRKTKVLSGEQRLGVLAATNTTTDSRRTIHDAKRALHRGSLLPRNRMKVQK